jgi:hypothetical protein
LAEKRRLLRWLSMLDNALDKELSVKTAGALARLHPNVAYQNVSLGKGNLASIDSPQKISIDNGYIQGRSPIIQAPFVPLLE